MGQKQNMELFFKMFFLVWLVQFWKKCNKSIIQALFIKIQPNMSEQEKKQQRIIYDLLNTETKPDFLCLVYTKQRLKNFTEKELFKEKWELRIEKKQKNF